LFARLVRVVGSPSRLPAVTHVAADETVEEEADESGTLRKRKFRSRAHANPLADPQFEYPVDRERLLQSSRATPSREAGCILALRDWG